MKEISVVTTIQLTDIISFEDSPNAYEGVLNYMDEIRKDIIEDVKKQYPLSDDVNVKVQFFVNDSYDADSDRPQNNPLFKGKCQHCRHKKNCFGDDVIVALKCQFGGFSFFVPANNANDND